jgi:hypothetical protein
MIHNKTKENKLKIKDVSGIAEFFWGKHNITALWMDFFGSLPMDKEKDCLEIFIRKYGKKLSKIYDTQSKN